ncbi:hypothetical protein Taro_038713 [Colocasia esculenta]|uniref:Uncharacterized protein n=1 Tax=Colocasia esculenta TaxID=4460 RepID=A0A843WN11_COLES|nr:hypothetical protein [Colocasia esculenta]
MSFLMLLDSLHMGEPTRIENELKNFLKIAYEGKEMRAMADKLDVIDLHVSNFLKTRATLDRGDLFIRTRMKKAGGPVNEESAAMIDSLAGRRVRILNFSGQVVANDILMSNDNDNVVMGKKLGVRLLQPVLVQVESKLIWTNHKSPPITCEQFDLLTISFLF